MGNHPFKKTKDMEIIIYSIILIMPIFIGAVLITKIVNFLEKQIDENK